VLAVTLSAFWTGCNAAWQKPAVTPVVPSASGPTPAPSSAARQPGSAEARLPPGSHSQAARLSAAAPWPGSAGVTTDAGTPPTGDPRLAKAREALARQDFRSAFQECEAAQKQGVPRPAVLELKADLFKATGYLDKEIETVRQWAVAAPRDQHPWLRLFYIYLDLGWRREAAQASDRALQLAPKDARSYVTRALRYYYSSEPALGLKPIQEARRLDPANTALANLHAAILIKTFRFPQAEAILRKTLERDPQNVSDRLALAQALLGEGKAQEAYTELSPVQQQAPDNLDVAFELGVLAEKRGDVAEATRQFERVAAADKHYSNVLWHLGKLYIRQGRAAEGQKLLKTYQTLDLNTHGYETALIRLESRPNDAGLHYQLAQFHLDAEEFPQAIVELRRVLLLRPGDARARQALIAALTRHGRVTEAQRLAAASSPRRVRQ